NESYSRSQRELKSMTAMTSLGCQTIKVCCCTAMYCSTTRQSLRKTLQANGLKVVRGAGKQLRFSAEEVTVESRNVGARRIEIRNVKFKVAIFDRDGTAGWSREWSLPRGTIDVSPNAAPTDGKAIKKLQDDLARVVENLPLPTYVFPKNWADRIGRSSLVRKP
ncbi:MAG: hypothetical protein VB878_05030, partial [Pirellulaceae bacterium]